MARLALFAFFFFLAAATCRVNCRVLSSESENSILISDGVDNGSDNQEEFLSLGPTQKLSKNVCVHVYGFLPCSDNVGGYAYQVFSFGCMLILGDYLLSEGRAKLFDIFEVGFYGGIVFPLLTMFPRIALMLSNGLSASHEVAQSMVVNNVGVTVGYTVFALTVQWGACVVFGMTGISGTISDQSVSRSEVERMTSRRRFYKMNILKSLADGHINADSGNKQAAGIMLLTLIPFVLVQLSEIVDSPTWRHNIVLITLIVSASATVFYFIYSYYDTADQMKSLKHARFELRSEVLKHVQSFSPGNILREGQVAKESIKSLFDKFDTNKDGKIQITELKEVSLEFGQLGRIKCDIHELAKTLIEEFDEDKDGEIDEKEFEMGITKWLDEHKYDSKKSEETAALKVERQNKSLREKLLSVKAMVAAVQVIGGILIVIFLARPLMMNIDLLSTSAGVPSFYITFVVIPLSRNLKNALSAHFCRRERKAEVTSLTFSEIYRDVTMNNLMGLSIILAIVYTRGLTWDYSTEVLIVLVVGLIIGLPAYLRSTYPFWICVLAFALYLISLALIYLHVHILK